MQKLVWQNANGVELDLTSGNYGITEWEGFSNASLNIQSQQVPFQDGGVFLDALIEQRELSVTLAMQDKNNLELRYQQRRELISALNPKLGEGYLIYTNDYISKRIKCIPQIPLFETHNSNDTGTPKASLSWTACEPYWEDLEETVVTFLTENLPIIKNEGDVPVQMEIVMQGNETENPQIVNITTGQKIKYEGEIGNLFINTNFGKKETSVRQYSYSEQEDLGDFNDVIYVGSKGVYYSVKNTGVIGVSYDGRNWEYLAQLNDVLFSISYSEEIGLFVVVGEEGKIYTSTDAISWTEQDSDVEEDLYQVRYSDIHHKFIAVGNYVVITESTDGVIWTKRKQGEYQNSLFSIYFDTNIIITVGGGFYGTTGYYSTDSGQTWNYINVGTYDGSLGNIIKKENTYYTYASMIFSSVDGITWTQIAENTYSIGQIVYLENKSYYVGIGIDGAYKSTDLVNWQKIADMDSTISYQLIYSPKSEGIFAVGTYNYTGTSKDGYVWNNYTEADLRIYSVIYSEKYKCFVLCGANGKIYTYSKEEGFSEKTSGMTEDLESICYSKNLDLFVIVGMEGIITSNDLENWTIVDTSDTDINFVCYSEELNTFMARGAKYLYSTDGVNWTNSQVTPSVGAFSLVVGKNCFIEYIYRGGGENTGFRKTTDGINWTTQTILDVRMVSNGAYISEKNKYYCVLGDSRFAESEDGENWSVLSVLPEYSGYSYQTPILFFEQDSRIYICTQYDILSSFDLNRWTVDKLNIVSGGDYLINAENNLWNFGQQYIMERVVSESQNTINRLSQDSDIGLRLDTGNNQINTFTKIGSLLTTIKYRQKYIGV